MKTTKQDIKGSYKTADGKAQIDFGITYRNGYAEFTASGFYDGSSGQCIDDIARAYPQDEKVEALAKLHSRFHLRDMTDNPIMLGTVARLALENPAVSFHDNQADQFLTSNGIKFRATLSDSKTPAWDEYTPKKPCPDCIKSSGIAKREYPLGHPQTVYEKQRGLNNPVYTHCKTCNRTGEVPDLDARKHGHHYRVTLYSVCAPDRGNHDTRRIVFDFWSSIKDAEDGIKTVSPYSVLACISGEAYTPETFADFCGEYGYEEDSIKALQTFRRCSAFAKRLRAFFTEAELEQLQEIN
jgi:hypothetical protein